MFDSSTPHSHSMQLVLVFTLLLFYCTSAINQVPQFLPNSLEVEVKVQPFYSKSVYYVACCDKVWLEFVVTACDYEKSWTVDVGFYSTQTMPLSKTESELENKNGGYNKPVASLIDQFHRKIVIVDPTQSKQGTYRLDLQGFSRTTTVRIFTSESNQSNYQEAFLPTSNVQSDRWADLEQKNMLKHMWMSWPKLQKVYKGFGDHLTCLTVLSFESFERCETCFYLSMDDDAGAERDNGVTESTENQCDKYLFKRCAFNYNYEPSFPEELRYSTEKLVGLVTKLNPVTGLVTPYFQETMSNVYHSEVAHPFMLSYVILRPKHEIKLDISEIKQMQWRQFYIIVQPCHSPVRVKISHNVSVIGSSVVSTFPVNPDSIIKLKNSHKTITSIRYLFTDDVILRNPLSFSPKTHATVDTSRSSCTNLVLKVFDPDPETEYCAIVSKIKAGEDLGKYETPACVNPKIAQLRDNDGSQQTTGDANGKNVWESCEITGKKLPNEVWIQKQAEINMDYVLPDMDVAIEVFAKPINKFYPLSIWIKVGDIFEAHVPSC